MKTTKLNRSILVRATLIMLFVAGCEKDEPKVHELVGTWLFTSGTIYYGSSVASADSSKAVTVFDNGTLTITFNDDNTGSSIFTEPGDVYTTEFSWSTSGSELVATNEDGTTSSGPLTYDVTGTTLTTTEHLVSTGDGVAEQWLMYVFQKQ